MTRQQLRVFLQGWFCGCGSPELAASKLQAMLSLCPFYENRAALEQMIPDAGVLELLLYTLDHFDLIEHGGSIGGSWLSDKGKQVLAALNREASDEFEALMEQSCMHGYSVDSDEIASCRECAQINA